MTYKDLKEVISGSRIALSSFVEYISPVIQARIARSLLKYKQQSSGRDIRQEVEDLTQEMFVILFDRQAKILRSWQPEKGLSLKNFVGLVTERQIASIMRTGKRNPWKEDPTLSEDMERETSVKPEGSADAEGQVVSRNMLDLLFEKLKEELSPLGLQLFYLIFVHEKTVKEVCDEMQMSSDAVYAWKSRLGKLSKKLLKNIMSESGGT